MPSNNQKPIINNQKMIKVHLFQILSVLHYSEVAHLVLRDQVTGNVYIGGRGVCGNIFCVSNGLTGI